MINEEEFNEKYIISPIKVSYENFNEAYQIFFGVKNKDGLTIQRIFSTYVHLKDCQNKMPSEIIQIGLLSIKETILNTMNNEQSFDNLLDVQLNI